MNLLTGEFRNTLDEKGRISLPAKLRNGLAGNSFVLTQGIDSCLWIFLPEKWEILSARMMESSSPFDAAARLVQRRIIAPAQEVEVDKLGRISVPQSLREWAHLSRDCVILGLSRYIELWDSDTYRSYLERTEADFIPAASAYKGLTL